MGNSQQKMTSSTDTTERLKSSISMINASNVTKLPPPAKSKSFCFKKHFTPSANNTTQPATVTTTTTTTTNLNEGFAHRFLNALRKQKPKLKTSQTLNLNSIMSEPKTSTTTGPHRSTTDHDLLNIKDNNNNQNTCEYDTDMIDLMYEYDEQQKNLQSTIDSKFLRDVNNKLKSIQDRSDDESKESYSLCSSLSTSSLSSPSTSASSSSLLLQEEEMLHLNKKSKLSKSPAIFNINSYTSKGLNNNGNDLKVKDLLNEQQINSEPSLSESSYSVKNDGLKVGKATSSSVSTFSSLSPFYSSNDDELDLEVVDPKPQPTAYKKFTIKDFLPTFKCKTRKKPLTLKQTETLLIEQINEQEKTESEKYSFKDRYEIKDPLGIGLDRESFCFIDETSSYSMSASSMFEQSKEDTRDFLEKQTAKPVFGFKNEVNKGLGFLKRHKNNKKKRMDRTEAALDSISNRIHNTGRQKPKRLIYNDQILDKIINKENDSYENDNFIEVVSLIESMNFENQDFDDQEHEFKLPMCFKSKMQQQQQLVNTDISSIAQIKVNAPLAASERSTPLFRSTDCLNGMEEDRRILLKSITHRNNITFNVVMQPIKKYYRLSNLSSFNKNNNNATN